VLSAALVCSSRYVRKCCAVTGVSTPSSQRILDQDVPRLPREPPERAGQDDGFDRGIPVSGGIELDLHGPEAVALKQNRPVAKRPHGCDGSLDVTMHFEKIVRVHVLVVLPRADADGRVPFG
jgi:hypothetical protein